MVGLQRLPFLVVVCCGCGWQQAVHFGFGCCEFDSLGGCLWSVTVDLHIAVEDLLVCCDAGTCFDECSRLGGDTGISAGASGPGSRPAALDGSASLLLWCTSSRRNSSTGYLRDFSAVAAGFLRGGGVLSTEGQS